MPLQKKARKKRKEMKISCNNSELSESTIKFIHAVFPCHFFVFSFYHHFLSLCLCFSFFTCVISIESLMQSLGVQSVEIIQTKCCCCFSFVRKVAHAQTHKHTQASLFFIRIYIIWSNFSAKIPIVLVTIVHHVVSELRCAPAYVYVGSHFYEPVNSCTNCRMICILCVYLCIGSIV